MYNSLLTLHPIPVLVVSLIGFLLGGLWFSPMIFSRAWLEELKLTPDQAKAASKGRTPIIFTTAVVCMILSTTALASFIALRHTTEPLKGAELGLFVGVCIVAARQATTMVFEMRTLRHFLIISGYDVAMFTILGGILAVWR